MATLVKKEFNKIYTSCSKPWPKMSFTPTTQARQESMNMDQHACHLLYTPTTWQLHNFSYLLTIVMSFMWGWQLQCLMVWGGSEGRTGIWEKQEGLCWDSEGLLPNSFRSLIGHLAFTSTYSLQRSQRCQISCDIPWFAAGLPLTPNVAAAI